MIRREPRRPRFGFTLVELLVVIVIIGILIGLLLPAIIAAVRRANEARVSAEIQTIATALAKFKDQYGEFPPSRVILSESGVYSLLADGNPLPHGADFQTLLTAMPIMNGLGTTTNLTAAKIGSPDISFGELASRSLRALRKFFPRAVLGAADQNGDGVADYWPDFNGNNVQDGSVASPAFLYLEGHECLVFFLGGIPNPSVDATGTFLFGTSGFGKEPLYPFKNAGVVASPMSTPNRTTPAYEFKSERLVDDDGDGIPGYVDPNGSRGVNPYPFYAYFAAYGGTGYDPNDVNLGDGPDHDFTVGNAFRVAQPTYPLSGPPTNLANTPYSPTPNPYTSSLPVPAAANQPTSYVSTNSFQIISCGGDQYFGPGGQWSSSGDRLPDPNGIRAHENDNITNFTSGKLN